MVGLVVGLLLSGARAEVVDDAAAWTAAFVQPNLHPARKTGPELWVDLHVRAAVSGGFAGIVRPGFGWVVAPGVAVWAGYAWVPSFGVGRPLGHEHRVWEQVTAARSWGAFSLGGRLRQEQRLRGPDDGVGHRTRVFGRAAVEVSSTVSLVGWDEVFFGLNDTGWQPLGFDQNRVFVGVAMRAPDGFRTELGYLNVWLDRAPDDTALHTASVSFFVAPKAPARD